MDIAVAIEQGRYVSSDVAETLSTFMVNDLPDPAQCLKVAGDLVMEAAKAAQGEPPRVAVCGETAPSLWAQGKADAAIQVERLWDEIAKSYDVDILCGYCPGTRSGRDGQPDLPTNLCRAFCRLLPVTVLVNMSAKPLFLPCRPCRMAA